MTDIRAALEDAVRILSGGHPGYVGDHSIRTVQVRQDTVDRLRAALAAASPEPEQCDHQWGIPSITPYRCAKCFVCSCQPAPAAPTVEALRDALVDDIKEMGWGHTPVIRRRLIELEAAIRADERTRLSGITHHEGEPTDVGPDTYRGFGGRTLLDAGEA